MHGVELTTRTAGEELHNSSHHKSSSRDRVERGGGKGYQACMTKGTKPAWGKGDAGWVKGCCTLPGSIETPMMLIAAPDASSSMFRGPKPAELAPGGFSSSASTIGSRRALNQPTNQPTNQHVKRAAQRDNPKWITNLSPAMQQPTMSMWQKRNNNKTLSGERIALERERETGDDKSERESLWRGGDTMCFLVVFFGRFDLFHAGEERGIGD